MPTRRQTTIGLLSLALGSAAISTAAFSSSTAAGADLRVVVTSDLRLERAREEQPDETKHLYVDTDDNGEVEGVNLSHLNQRSVSEFAGLINVVNNGNVSYDRLVFDFISDTTPSTQGDPADLFSIITDVPTTIEDETTIMQPVGGLTPGEFVTFGLTVNLLESTAPGEVNNIPDDGIAVTLRIRAESEEELE